MFSTFEFFYEIYRSLPPRWRQRMKSLLAAHGHVRGPLDRIKVTRMARGRKRLDRAASDLRQRLELAGVDSLVDKACLELGAGYVLAEPLLFDLLGASQAWAVDYNRIACETGLRRSVRATAPAQVRQALQDFQRPADFDQRLAELFAGGRVELSRRMQDRVRYLAPFDNSARCLDQPFDLIDSVSVLEHVPCGQVPALLGNLAESLQPGGTMIHRIDLRDHRDLDGDSLGFLAEQDYADALADSRGNRLRRSHWQALFDRLPGLHTRCITTRSSVPQRLPVQLAGEFRELPAEDLLVTEILAVSHRPA